MATAKRDVEFVKANDDPTSRRYLMVKGVRLFMEPGEAAALLRMCDLIIGEGAFGRGIQRDAQMFADELVKLVFEDKTEK